MASPAAIADAFARVRAAGFVGRAGRHPQGGRARHQWLVETEPVICFIGALTGGLCWLAIGFLMMVASYALNARLPADFGWYSVLFVFEGWCVLATGYDMNKNGSLSTGAAPRHVARGDEAVG